MKRYIWRNKSRNVKYINSKCRHEAVRRSNFFIEVGVQILYNNITQAEVKVLNPQEVQLLQKVYMGKCNWVLVLVEESYTLKAPNRWIVARLSHIESVVVHLLVCFYFLPAQLFKNLPYTALVHFHLRLTFNHKLLLAEGSRALN